LRFVTIDRLSYWIAPGRRIILLTVIGKRQMREGRQIERAKAALDRCIARAHTADEEELA